MPEIAGFSIPEDLWETLISETSLLFANYVTHKSAPGSTPDVSTEYKWGQLDRAEHQLISLIRDKTDDFQSRDDQILIGEPYVTIMNAVAYLAEQRAYPTLPDNLKEIAKQEMVTTPPR